MIKSKKLSKFSFIKHGFFNRLGDNSTGIYKSLNCASGSSDKRNKIHENLKIVVSKIKPKSRKIFLPDQFHSNKFHFIDKKLKIGNYKFKGDAFITNRPGTPIGILTADCAPILLFDQKKIMVAAIHAGWKGAYKGIINKVIKFMIKKGCSTDSINAVIGPCISVKSYEVKQDFINKFIKKDPKNKKFFKRIRNKNYFSLNKYVAYQLKIMNIKKVEVINKDTFDVKNNFFSARRSKSHNENDYGRNISVIMIN
ncbi:peptidoglycan editing factor PgeF [Candidatus Pelagibacter sp.]|nr:peptidoglycan editing factor PgeF [Candidatus Pelagibacter sp.]